MSVRWKNPDKQGELTKQGHIVKNWKVRWFVKKNSELFYFKTKDSTVPISTINLVKCTVSRVLGDSQHPFCFELVSPQNNKSFLIATKTEQELDEWLTALKNIETISTPIAVRHVHHIQYDEKTREFNGVPDAWKQILHAAGITNEEYQNNPRQVLEVIDFEQHREEGTNYESLVPRFLPPDFQLPPLDTLVSKENPVKIYECLKKLGRGAFGDVQLARDSRNDLRVAIKKNERHTKKTRNIS